jgi:hypothetical protein
MTKEDWRATVFVWDGILSFIERDEKENKAENGGGGGEEEEKDGKEADDMIEGDGLRLRWRGTWIGCDSVDAAKVRTPRRGAFDEFVSSDHGFEVEGAVSRVTTTDDDDDNDDDDDPKGGGGERLRHWVCMTGGPGYELGDGSEKEYRRDDRHDVYFFSPTLRWSGNLRNQVPNVVLAVGENEFGNFVSVGWLRVGNRVTLARRYVGKDDERSGWDVEDLKKAVFEQIATTEVDGHTEIVIPPWQCAAMHADAGNGFKRQKIESKSES